jgi:hypothetical protein
MHTGTQSTWFTSAALTDSESHLRMSGYTQSPSLTVGSDTLTLKGTSDTMIVTLNPADGTIVSYSNDTHNNRNQNQSVTLMLGAPYLSI